MELYLMKCKTGNLYQIPSVSGITIAYSNKSASTLSMSKLKLSMKVEVGDILILQTGSTVHWKGTVFVEDDSQVKAYCLLRYLKNADIVTYEDITLSDFVEKASQSCNVTYQPQTRTTRLVELIEIDNKEYLTEIATQLEEELLYTGTQYLMQGHLGFITLLNQNKCIYKQTLNLTNLTVQRSIDGATYNQVIVYDSEKTSYGIAQNLESIRSYGLLRYIVSADVSDNLDYYASLYLGLHNSVKVDCKLTCIGGQELLAITQGWIVPLQTEDINQYMIVDSVTHKISNTGVETNITCRNYTEELI